MCSETTPLCLSFSYDISDQHDFTKKPDIPGKDADELFSNGMILPIMMQQERNATWKHTHYGESPYMKLPQRPFSPRIDKMKKKESIRKALDEKKTQSRSFWGFSRSRSLKCDTNKNLITYLPLMRSKSTDSNRPISLSSPSPSPSILNLYPVQKSASGKSYNNTLRISPVLNVPTPCISKGGASLFMLGSFLRVGKVKKSKN
ncbi:hypothetical protein Lal_00026987 [Lupinus albus]|uniref:Uncharacterized protein n=1 Tax=Lupinus albus TaxID=3870 RepID=A0A6A4Q204_LUPAL|nr:hypothetical protein Lalb_Chr09g0331061 [Lupinus albus]KAF1862453.1 hypothetical protein Lal_00026987 [Lupinus albus]